MKYSHGAAWQLQPALSSPSLNGVLKDKEKIIL